MLTSDRVRCLVLGSAALLMASVATCGGADSCVAVRCSSGALMRIQLVPPPFPDVGSSITGGLRGSTLTACRNAECYSSTLPDVPAAGGTEESFFFGGTTFVLGSLWQNPDQSVDMDVVWYLSTSQVVNGDHYVVTLNQGGVTTTLLDKTATYEPVARSPEECEGGEVCLFAVLTP
jgi:hypothetical protein